jgi:tripartite-type tricarboxylate transporter receptor subunit TctC
LVIEYFSIMAQVRMTHVPYKGATLGLIALIACQVAIMAPDMITGVSHVRAGTLRALGMISASRVAAAPDIPTIGEGRLPGYEAVT